MYGLVQDNLKEQFLADLVQMYSHETLPIMIGGDFNILRNPLEKNNDNYDDRWPFLFNAVIEGLNLRELELTGRQFTWANSLQTPTFEKLDRVLMSTDWEQKFPKSTVVAEARELSDHTPLLLLSGDPQTGVHQHIFKFELGWLLRDGFTEMVSELWEKETGGSSPLGN